MDLGAFSVSLAVKDIAASRAFYETLGFSEFGGNQDQNWLIMKNATTVIGLFQGMFDKNLLTFNPGRDGEAQPLASFTDIRDIQRHLLTNGVAIGQTVDEATIGPGHLFIEDPDGNQILIDQHV